MTTLSAPQVHALLDHMCARHAGSHSFLAAVQHGTTLMRPESFLWNGPTHFLQSFFDRLLDHQTEGFTHPTQIEMEVDHFRKVLQACLVDVTSNPSLMLDFSCGIKGVPTIDLTKDKAVVRYLLLKGNIADYPEDNLEMTTTAPGPSNHHQTVHEESSRSAVPPHTNSDAAPGTSSASALGIIPTASLATDKQQFFPQSIGRLKALMSKENRTQTLIKVGAEEASTHFDAHVVPDEEDDTQMEGSKPVKADKVTDKEAPEATNKEDGSQTSKSMDKKPAEKHSNRASSGTRDGPVCYDRDILTDGHKEKYPKDHISVHCVQGAGQVLLMSCFAG